jgi:hypothetical protein
MAAPPHSLARGLRLEPLPEDPLRFAQETFVYPARHRSTGFRVDFIFSTTDYKRQAIDRAVLVDLGGTSIPFASAEDLIIHKLFAGRARDWEDPSASSAGRERGWTGATSNGGVACSPRSQGGRTCRHRSRGFSRTRAEATRRYVRAVYPRRRLHPRPRGLFRSRP